MPDDSIGQLSVEPHPGFVRLRDLPKATRDEIEPAGLWITLADMRQALTARRAIPPLAGRRRNASGEMLGAVQPAPMPPAFTRQVPAMRRLKLLALDDNRTRSLMLEKYLRGLAVELHQASSPEAALALHRNHQPDVLLIDCDLPGQGCARVMASIRAAEAHEGLPPAQLILAGEDPQRISTESGISRLTHPLRRSELLEVLERCLRPGMEGLAQTREA